jgi:transposase-like protein
MATLTINVFNVTNRCPVCGGAANSRYHGRDEVGASQMKRKCTDCGYTWDEVPTTREL